MPDITTRRQPQQPTVVMRTTVPVESIPSFLARAFHDTAEFIGTHGADFAGPPFARYAAVTEDVRVFEIEAGFPVVPAIGGDGEIEASTLPDCDVATVTHLGSYDAMRPTYELITEWLDGHQAVPTGPPWEVYYSDPDSQPDPATWRTDIVQPYRLLVTSQA